MKKLDSFTLKLIAIFTMILDHIYTYSFGTSVTIPDWFGLLGKLSAPIFFYLIVEGFFHTKNRFKYFSRLAIFGGIMVIVDKLLGIHNNIFLSLALSILILIMIDYFKKFKNISYKILLLLPIGLTAYIYLCYTEASIYGLVMTLIFYFCRNKKILMSILYVMFYGFFLITVLPTPEPNIFTINNQWFAMFSIIPILMYNGKLGLKNTFTNWMFYFIYPIHLIIIVLTMRLF